jgi:uncharacterized membrane protein YeaQ/YmgE (transglycosylase-associated protein family)
MGLLSFIIVGALAGWLAGQFMRGRGFGFLGDIAVGTIGAAVGGYLFNESGIRVQGGMLVALLVAFGGAILLLFVVRVATRGRRSMTS